MEAGAEVIATEILLFEIKLSERMRAVHNRLDSFGASHLADSLHGGDLSRDVDLVRDENQAGAAGNSFFKRCADLIEVLWRNGNLNQLKLEAFSPRTLTKRGKHARIILGGGENFITRLKVHAHQKNLELLGSITRDCDLFAIAAEQFRQTSANRFRLWLEDLPHGVGGGVFLFPGVTHQRVSHDTWAGRNAAVVQVDNATRYGESVLNDGPILFYHGGLLRCQIRHALGRGCDGFQQRRDRGRRKRGQTEAFAREQKKVASSALTKRGF